MTMSRSIIQIVAGAAFGVVAVLSCTDSPRHSDAAACDCPASEPPIAGRVVVFEGQPRTVAAGQQSSVAVQCMPGMQFVSGSCTAGDPTVLEDITVQQFGFNKTTFSWSCVFKNNKAVPVDVKALVMCLKPAT